MKNTLTVIPPPQILVPGNDTPLGTAAWQDPARSAVRPFVQGDFFVGYDEQGRMLGVHDDRHVSINAGTRGGKGVGSIIQNLLLWKGSAAVIDPKGENAMVTARRRGGGSGYSGGMGQTVRILDPFDTVETRYDDFKDLKACFNPLDIIRADNKHAVGDAAQIAEALIVFRKFERAFLGGLRPPRFSKELYCT